MAKRTTTKPKIVNNRVEDVEENIEVAEVANDKVDTEEKAKKVLESYDVPSYVKTAFVCEDKQVFWDYNESAAFAHAREKGLRIFEIKF